jgi:VIT1/CCC1 family predicted Fe2+/Mn2+ transporter
MDSLTESKRLLNQVDRAAEILFGLIMALSITCSISIANAHHSEVRQLLVGAIGCNLAWGFVDATMYLIGVLVRRNRNKIIFDLIQNSSETDRARKYISDALPPIVASVIETEGLEEIRLKLINLPNTTRQVRLKVRDLYKAIGLFCLVVISTLPVVVPFVFIHNTRLALRVSNLVAVVIMFCCGWSVAKYAGFGKWEMSLAMVLIGIILVAVTIALGG